MSLKTAGLCSGIAFVFVKAACKTGHHAATQHQFEEGTLFLLDSAVTYQVQCKICHEKAL